MTNACLAWWIYASITTRKILPVNFRPSSGETRLRTARRIVSNPLIVLTIVWILWIIVAGIIKATHTTDVRNKVQVATVTIGSSFGESKQNAVRLGQAIAHQAKTTQAKFIVTPEFSLYANEIYREFGDTDSCEDLILNYLYPEIRGLGVYAVVGCFRHSLSKPPNGKRSCRTDNLAYTLSPDGEIIGVYGKLQPTPGEESCYQPGVSVQTAQNEITGIPFKFSSLICYDMDFMSPTAKAADLGDSLILNPANDWIGVRHHYAVLVIRAIENRVAIVKAERSLDPAIVDPFGNIIALGKGVKSSASLSGSVQLTTPLKISWVRQQMPYWICILVYAVYLGLDIFRLYKRKFRKV
jgi:predicted amidohydrolase